MADKLENLLNDRLAKTEKAVEKKEVYDMTNNLISLLSKDEREYRHIITELEKCALSDSNKKQSLLLAGSKYKKRVDAIAFYNYEDVIYIIDIDFKSIFNKKEIKLLHKLAITNYNSWRGYILRRNIEATNFIDSNSDIYKDVINRIYNYYKDKYDKVTNDLKDLKEQSAKYLKEYKKILYGSEQLGD